MGGQSGLGVDQAFATWCSLLQAALPASAVSPPWFQLPAASSSWAPRLVHTVSFLLPLWPQGEWPRFSPLLVSGLPHHAPQAFQLFLHLCHQSFVLNSVCSTTIVWALSSPLEPHSLGTHRESGVGPCLHLGEGDLGLGGALPPASQMTAGKSQSPWSWCPPLQNEVTS